MSNYFYQFNKLPFGQDIFYKFAEEGFSPSPPIEMITEDGDPMITEDGDFMILE